MPYSRDNRDQNIEKHIHEANSNFVRCIQIILPSRYPPRAFHANVPSLLHAATDRANSFPINRNAGSSFVQ